MPRARKPRSVQAIRKIITEWKKDPNKMEEWASDRLFTMALVLQDQIDFPGEGVGAKQAQLAAVKQMYDIITVMLEDILPNKEGLGFGGKGKEVPKYEAGGSADAESPTGGKNPRFTPRPAPSGAKLGATPVELSERGGSPDERTDLLDPGREG